MSSLDSDITSRQEPQIHLYAEHLHNIRTLSIQASLATKSNKETKATLSADGSRLTLKHEGQDASIQLPITNLGSENEATLTIPAAPTRELNIRLNIEEKPGSGLLSDRTISEENIIPWMSSDLSHETEVCCASCEAVLIKRGAIKQWKDLPSEGWAEMMDFWHCHKPDVPLDRHSTDAPERGISANSKLVVEQGVGLVGPMDLLFAQDHCTSLEVGSHDPSSSAHHITSSQSRKSPLAFKHGRFKEPALSGCNATFEESVGIQAPHTNTQFLSPASASLRQWSSWLGVLAQV